VYTHPKIAGVDSPSRLPKTQGMSEIRRRRGLCRAFIAENKEEYVSARIVEKYRNFGSSGGVRCSEMIWGACALIGPARLQDVQKCFPHPTVSEIIAKRSGFKGGKGYRQEVKR